MEETKKQHFAIKLSNYFNELASKCDKVNAKLDSFRISTKKSYNTKMADFYRKVATVATKQEKKYINNIINSSDLV